MDCQQRFQPNIAEVLFEVYCFKHEMLHVASYTDALIYHSAVFRIVNHSTTYSYKIYWFIAL